MKLFERNNFERFSLFKNNQEINHLKLVVNYENYKYINNLKTNVNFSVLENTILPFTINDNIEDNSYVCSIYTAIILYSLHEIMKINNNTIRFLLKILIFTLKPIVIIGKIDKIISSNNFLLSTNIFPNISNLSIEKYIYKKLKRYPKHLFLIRSLNFHLNESLLNYLKQIGFKLVPSRQVYIFDKKVKDYTKSHNFKIDLKFMENQKTYKPCFLDKATISDYKRIAELYYKLYIIKYSEYNPIYNYKYIEFSHENKLIEYYVLKNENGIIDAVIGFYDRDNVSTAPIVGYDTNLPKQYGLYRILMSFAINRADKKNMTLNLSSGASHFKTLRGGVPFIEYSAIYFDHLENKLQKYVWKFLSYILIHLADPIFKKYKL